jgi:prolyl 4-hydroxylase
MKTLTFLCTIFCLLGFGHANDSLQKLCESPRIYLITDFLTPEQCDHIIEQATPKLARSTVLDAKGGLVDSRRTSYGMFFASAPTDPILKEIEEKIARITQMPVENGEGLQVLHYEVGGEFQPHHDYFTSLQPGGPQALSRGGQRVATLMMYLNTTEKGGETIFPKAGISISPKKGQAVLFYNVTPSGVEDPQSLHGGAPVLAGEKWIVTKWIRKGPFY